jgi:hypothetical protein
MPRLSDFPLVFKFCKAKKSKTVIRRGFEAQSSKLINTRYHFVTEFQKKERKKKEQAVAELGLDDPIPEANQKRDFEIVKGTVDPRIGKGNFQNLQLCGDF